MPFLLVVSFLAFIATSAHAAESNSHPDSPAAVSVTRLADPATWGVYAYLVGGEWKASFGRSRSFQWGEGNEIVLTGKALAAEVVQFIRPAGPGQLELVVRDTPTNRWTGHIALDGSVVWTHDAQRGIPFRHSLRDGVFITETIELRDNKVVSTWDAIKFKGTPAAVAAARSEAAAELAAQPAPVSDASTADSSKLPISKPNNVSGDPSWPRFPAVPNVPELAPLIQAKALYEELTAVDWAPQVSATGPGMATRPNGSIVERIKGEAFCARKKGSVEVRYEPVKDSGLGLIAFRGQEADCNGQSNGVTRGIYRFSDGRILIGDISISRNNLRVRMTGTGIIWNDDDICISVVGTDFRVTSHACWNRAVNIFATAFDSPLNSAQPVRGRLVFPTLGYINGQFQGGEFKTPREAVFIASDDSVRITGQLMPATTLPRGAVLRAGENVNASSARFFFTGLMRFETKIRTELGGPGAYLYYGAVEPGALPANVRPEPATLAKYASLAADCLLKPQLPVGWLPWGPDCDHVPDRLDAWSVNGQLRLQYSADETVLQEFDPQRPGTVVAEWRADMFSRDPVPSILGTGELWRGGRMMFRGKFSGLTPQGEGQCTVPGSHELELCTYNAGERVDALYLARVEQNKLDAEREAARLQAEADERAREAAARLEAARRAAAQQNTESGFQWGKFTALTAGALAGGAGELDAALQADLLVGAIADSASGNEGLTHTTAAMNSVSTSTLSTPAYNDAPAITTPSHTPSQFDQNKLPAASTAQCNDYPIKYHASSGWLASRESAEGKARSGAETKCGGTNGGISTVDLQCRSHQPEFVNISSTGKVNKEAPQPPQWMCVADGVCNATRRLCDSGSPGASRQ